MAVSYEKDYLDIHDIRKAIKDGRIRISSHALTQAVREERNINVTQYLETLYKMPPTHDKPRIDRDEGMPGYMATVEMDGRLVTGAFVKSSEIGQNDIIVVKTVYLYDPLFHQRQQQEHKWDSSPNPPLPLPEGKVVPLRSVKETIPASGIGFCASCSMAKSMMGKTLCQHHRVTKITPEGVATISMCIAEPDISACEAYKAKKTA